MTRLFVAAVACSTLALPASAAPQWGDRGRDDRGGWQNRATGEAYQRGYRDGVREGEEDERRGRSFNVQNHDEFRRADAGYDRNDGSRERYRDEFRRGFTDGYRVGYRDNRWSNGNRRGPAPAVYRDAAQARGFSDGYKKGLDDRRDNRRFEPQRHNDYREADQGYNGSYGSKDRYKIEYREGFRAGYEDGYQGGFARR